MEIVFIGTPDFALPSLSLLNKHHNIPLVITQKDKPKGRGKKLFSPPVKQFSQKLNLEFIQPNSIKNDSVIKILKSIAPDIFVVVAFGQILPKEVLDIPKFGSINVHASILPKYRGASPIQQAIINGEKNTGVTTMFMDEGLDTGDILLQKKIKIEKNYTTELLFQKLSKIGGNLLIETIKKLENGDLKRIKQDDKFATYCKIFKKKDGAINWNTKALDIENFVRGINPWPGAYTFINENRFKIFEVKKTDFKKDGNSGEIAFLAKDKLFINAKDFKVAITRIQSPSGKVLDIEDFLRGSLKLIKWNTNDSKLTQKKMIIHNRKIFKNIGKYDSFFYSNTKLT